MRVLLTGVTSATHAIYAASYLRTVLAQGPVELALPVGVGGDLTEREVRALLPQDDGLQFATDRSWSLPRHLPFTYLAVGAPGLKAYAALRRANPRRAIHTVVIDEGLGTYGTWRTRRRAWAREGVSEPWRSVRALAVGASGRMLTTKRWPTYLHRDGQWQVNEPVAQEFRGHVRGRAGSVSPGPVMVMSQPWIDHNAVSRGAYLDHLRTIAAQVNSIGREVLICPHPREPQGRYADIGEVRRVGPAEIDPQIAGAEAVIGGPSTALLNMASIHGVPAVRVGVPGRPDLTTHVSARQRSLLDQYLGLVVADEQVGAQLRRLLSAPPVTLRR